MDNRLMIGLLTNDLVGSYPYEFWSGMKSAARKEDCDLVSFNGGEIDSPDPTKRKRNAAFDLVHKARPDGLVVLSPVIANSGSESRVKSFIDSLMPIPLITVGLEIDGHPSSLIDNYAGMTRVVEHLVLDHGRTMLAFVGGPERNREAAIRRQAMLDTLSRLRIPFDPTLEVVGEFDFGIARDMVRSLLGRGASFEALVAANDEMALGAIEALKEYGRRVPHDVAVVGFDGIKDGLHSIPSLTTVRQPIFEQGAACLHRILGILERGRAGNSDPLTVSVVRRGSCGCQSQAVEEACQVSISGTLPVSVRDGLGSPAHLREIGKSCTLAQGSPRVARLFDDFLAALLKDSRSRDSSSSVDAFIALVRGSVSELHDADPWQTTITRIRTASLPFYRIDLQRGLAFEGLLHQARILAHQYVVQWTAHHSLQMQRCAWRLQEIGAQVMNKPEIGHLVELLARECKSFRISSLHLLVRDSGEETDSLRLVLSIEGGVRSPLPPEGVVQEPEDLFRRIVQDSPIRSALVVEPLFFKDVDLGFMLVDLVSRRGMLLDSLSGMISATIMGARASKEGSSVSKGGKASSRTTSDKAQGFGPVKTETLRRMPDGWPPSINTPTTRGI